MRILVVEDEKRLAAALKRGLEAEGFAVDVALDGTDGLWMARENSYDALIADIMLQGIRRPDETLTKPRGVPAYACRKLNSWDALATMQES